MEARKQNRLTEYDYSQNGAYYVTICTQDRRPFLSYIAGDGFPVPKEVGKIAEDFIRQIPSHYPDVRVDKYVIMPDHIHILFRIRETENPPTMGTIVGWYKYQVTKQANLLYQTSGKRIFQRSYHDHVVRNQQDYDEIWQYIENNPRKWLMQMRRDG